MEQLLNIQDLVSVISETNQFFKNQAQKQVNVALTLRNWLIGFYISEYELNGADRAEYGQKVFKEIAKRLKHLKGMSERNLYLFKEFYLCYPQIQQSLNVELYLNDFQPIGILQSATAKLNTPVKSKNINPIQTDIDKLINPLSFTHIIELLKADSSLKRSFYEIQAIKNAWTVRELERAMNSMLFERTGLSTDKEAVLEKHAKQKKLLPEDVFRNPYILEFLGLKEETSYSESDLEQAIINHLQTFLLELGSGFCFEARQKRITFDNTHYKIDLVFYHRILKCHVIVDLKLGAFTHADSGQMTVYLNYYNDNEKNEGDNPPIGIILCASKNESLVKYATTNLTQQVFVSKYLIKLPSEKELENIIREEQQKLGL